MEKLTCVFCGHRHVPETLYEEVYQIVEKLICQYGVTQFYCGAKGEFDWLAARAVYALKKSYTHICSYKILAYLPEKLQQDSSGYFDGTIFPEGLEMVPKRFAMIYRNRWMALQADYIVGYVKTSGGAKTMLDYAAKKGHAYLINLAMELPGSVGSWRK